MHLEGGGQGYESGSVIFYILSCGEQNVCEINLHHLFILFNVYFIQYFPDYIDQQLKLFDQNNNPVDITRKSILELTKPSIHKIDDDYYWIWGPKEVHHLNHVRSEGPGHYTSKLSEDDILNLPVELVYVGIGVNHFLDDEKKALDILLQIIMKMNMMQDTKFYSFPLGEYFLFNHGWVGYNGLSF